MVLIINSNLKEGSYIIDKIISKTRNSFSKVQLLQWWCLEPQLPLEYNNYSLFVVRGFRNMYRLFYIKIISTHRILNF